MSQKESFVDYDGLVEDIAIEDQDSEVEVLAEVDAEDYDGTKKKIFQGEGLKGKINQKLQKFRVLKMENIREL